MTPRALGLYVHIPFCRRLCPYCDFAVAVRRSPPHEEYCDALLEEWHARQSELADRELCTVYFGGGTPGFWSLVALKRFLAEIPTDTVSEVTLEANPHDITPEKLDAWAALGVNRVSLGVQSFDDGTLRGLGRDHDGELASAAARRLVDDGRFRTSIDLIYGGPGTSPSTSTADVELLIEIGPDHISAYELTIEARTVFGRRHRAGELRLPDASVTEDVGLAFAARLAAAGYDRYEVSSYGRAGDVALHNSGYWLGREYVGLGVGAHSLLLTERRIERRNNSRNLKGYMKDPSEPMEREILTAAEHLGERLFLAARTRLGVSWAELRRQFRTVDSATWNQLEIVRAAIVERGFLERDEATLRPTQMGIDFADWIAEEFWQVVRLP